MRKAISEETKQKISEMYNLSDISNSAIAHALGVSERTVYRYKNYGRPVMSSQTRPSECRQTSHDQADESLDITGKPSLPRQSDQALESPGEPSHSEADLALDVTERPSPPENEEGSEQLNFVGGKEFKAEEPENEEFDWECNKCGHEFNGSPKFCPGCGAELEFEFDYECSECGYQFNRDLKECPKCGDKFD